MVTYNDKKLGIKALVESGKTILEVEIAGQSVFFIVSMFEPPVGGSVSALPYMTFQGKDITEFLIGDVFSLADVHNYLTRFEAKFQNEQGQQFKLSDSHIWRLYE